MRKSLLKACLLFVGFASLITSVGCYETLFRLAPLEDAKVDRELCGDWHLKSSGGAEVYLGVRNLDDRSYSISWRGADTPTALHMIADTTLVGGVRFAHARTLPVDGSIVDTHQILRVDVEGDQITLRNLSDPFLKQRKIESDDALRAEIEANIDNNDLYDDLTFTGKRVAEGDEHGV